ncbi:MAG: NACHT domain-containing protein [Acidobacteria bacterium]|nr:NACHT domain-containing protein [Acidobacteriota bacterium]
MASILKRNLAADYAWLLAQKFNVVDMLGLPSYKDTRSLSLEEIYVPLRFQWELRPRAEEKPFWLPKLMNEAKHLVVLGDPGCGKSTLIKFLVYSFGHPGATTLAPRFGNLLPIPIILREFKVAHWQRPEDMLSDFISTLASEVRNDVRVDWLMDYLRKGKALLMLDGLDEIGSVELRRNFRDKVVSPLLREATESFFIATSRVIGYEEVPFDKAEYQAVDSPHRDYRDKNFDDAPLRLWHSFQRCYVAPFTDEDISQFINRWYAAREPDESRRREGAESLTSALQQNDRVRRLAQNPSLLTLIALVFRVLRHLPSGRVQLYHKIVEAYLETIQTYRQLGQFPATLEQMKRWLARVGWEMQSLRTKEDQGDLMAPAGRVLEWLTEVIKQDRGNDESAARHEAEQFLDYVARRSGLLIPRGTNDAGNLFAFVHLTFQEYFAAWELRGRMRRFDLLAEICAKRVGHTYWHETLLLLFEVLAEFTGCGDDLIGELCRRAKNDQTKAGTAQLFSALLLDTQNGLSEAGQQQAAEFAREQMCRQIDNSVIERLKQLPAERRSQWIEKPLIQQLKSARPEMLTADFFLAGDEFVSEWPQLIEDELVGKRGSGKWKPNQLAVIPLIGAGKAKVIEWTGGRLPVHYWLVPAWWGYLRQITIDGREVIVGSISAAELNLTLVCDANNRSPVHQLLAQSALALAAGGSQIFQTTIMDRSLARSLARSLDRSLDRSLARSLARSLDRSLDRSLAQNLSVATTSVPLDFTSPKGNSLLKESATSEWLATQPDHEKERLNTVTQLQPYLKAKDDWTRLLAINNLITLSAGTPELVQERNRLCDKAMTTPDKFTFPADLAEATKDKEWFNLPEIIAIIFLHEPGDPFLKPEWFDPKREESKFFLSPPREFFALAAEVLDPEGKTELAKWR